MYTERIPDKDVPLSNDLDTSKYPILTREEATKYTKILPTEISRNNRDRIIQIGKTTMPTILLMGPPHTGKTGFLNGIEGTKIYELPVSVYHEKRPTYQFDPSDEYGAFNWCVAYTLISLGQLSLNFEPEQDEIRIFDGGLLDQLIFAKGITEISETNNTKQILALKNLFTVFDFLSQIDGIIILNAKPETCIKNRSKTNINLLEKICKGFKKFPTTYNSYFKNYPHIMPTIILDFDVNENIPDLLVRSLNTLIYWNMKGFVPNSHWANSERTTFTF